MKISVLVPVFGVERYIEACAKSLFEQTYEDLEYIFVDDCSPDNSIRLLQNILERYPHRYKQVRILRHQCNRGLGAARATALDAATGDFVMVVDSDDKLPGEAISMLWRRQQESGADIVDGAFQRLIASGMTDPTYPFHGSKQQYLQLMLLQNVVSHQLWGRLIRRTLFTENGINSIEGVNQAEDYAVMPRLLFCGSRSWTDEVVYYYRQNNESTFADNLSPRHVNSYLLANGAVCNFLKRHHYLKRHYRLALGIGMLRAYHTALQTGLTPEETAKLCDYQLSVCLIPFCRKPFLPVLHLIYLVTKRLFVLFCFDFMNVVKRNYLQL